MNATWLLGWWNLVFIAPFLLALLYLGLYTVSGLTFGDADADAGLDGDADLDADGDVDAGTDVSPEADLDADADVDADSDLDADADADADADPDAHGHDSDGTSVLAAMNWLGVGRVPLSILLMVLLLTWGAVGFVTNRLLLPVTQPGWRTAAISIPVAAAASLALTRLVVRAMARWLPMNETTAKRRHEVLGSVGEAVFPIGRQFGLVSVRDRGELFQLPCRVEPDREPIAKGSKVLLVGYNAKDKSFYVVPFDTGVSGS